VELETLKKAEVDYAATALAFFLTSGLAAGSLASFAVRGAICQCNPFLSS
jgi:equilibrative nucleoside transporter 1/2/3